MNFLKKYKILERLCVPKVCDGASGCGGVRPLWLHGASLGECRMLVSVARALKSDWAECPPILLTTQKAEAVEPLSKMAGGVCRVAIAPADLPFVVWRFVRRLNPMALVLGENELWPGYVRCMRDRGLALVSGRVRKTPPWVDFKKFGFVSMQSDGGNWKILDWARSGAEVCPPKDPDVDVFFISFHKEELPAFLSLAEAAVVKNEAVVLAPRRLEEAELFCDALRAKNFKVMAWPEIQKGAVSVVKKFGLVREILGRSRRAVVGGSFDKSLGVHDFWEPLCAGVETSVGPFACDSSWDALAGAPSAKEALLCEREKILNSYERLLCFLKAAQKEPAL